MPRKLAETTSEVSNNQLDELVPQYAHNKETADNLKKTLDSQNKAIKELMEESKIDKYSAGGYKASYIVQHRETMNEEKLLNIIHNNPDVFEGLGVVQVKECVDMDALENALYNGKIPQDIVSKLTTCKETKDVVTLRIAKEGKK